MDTANLAAMPLNYLDKALNRLRDLGLMPEKPDEAPVVALIKQISDLDEEGGGDGGFGGFGGNFGGVSGGEFKTGGDFEAHLNRK